MTNGRVHRTGSRTPAVKVGRFPESRRAFDPPLASSTTHPVGPLGGRGLARSPVGISASLLLAITILLLISITFRQDESAEDLDLQVAVRAVGYSLAALVALFALFRGKMRISIPIGIWLLVPLVIIGTALYAPSPAYAVTGGLAHLAVLLFAWHFVNSQGAARAMLLLILTGTIIGIASIFAYFAFPDLGRSIATAIEADPGGRMKGVTGQANALGMICALTVLLAVTSYSDLGHRRILVAAVAIVVGAVCLISSDSRTAMAALASCLLLWTLWKRNPAINLFVIVAIALVGCAILTFVPDVAPYLTRTGSRADDLATLNGRREIWDVVSEGIRAHPFLGEGYGASRVFLPQDDRLFLAAVNAHNVFLELLYSGGLLLLLLYATGVGWSLIRNLRRMQVAPLIALIFFLVIGTTTSTPYAGLPLFPAIAFYVVVACSLGARTAGAALRWSPRLAGERPRLPDWRRKMPQAGLGQTVAVDKSGSE